ncbi:class II aldolase/adducin family protein [Frankia sp. CNm7]|uniref:Class II aldolase/adducin family protein n=1 Tax=Frankia nepalensis TaxID=1836974 RepID=A0A937RQI6_9ACTN|nr:class II aldolase/adducin family protein [Frankia nepalensis]MBL7497862.1 class II aldolase/adducin family protein [Frankia nepalensis]MBL7509685.1 class II aldolase/adducin family protein [Frankia nepalensis]MBL7517620.1 class II aldolase/adducin family protein [Frankia nepalensis]MBL7630818.1 class II aldolase/adducin family protein [Frankia nepalensis]
MTFVPTAEKLMPELSTREEIALLARALWREGYNDHLAGHITALQPDGTLLCNPWLVRWDELRPEQIIRIDLAGNLLEGDWPVPLGIPLHLALHAARADVTWAVHNHPLYGTVWADMGEIPPIYDQSSALGGGGDLVLVNEYEGPVNDAATARGAVDAMGGGHLALLAGHGVFVLGTSARSVFQRAVALEQRCQRAWHVRAAGATPSQVLPAGFLNHMRNSDGDGFIGFWETAVRAELRADPTLLDTR